MTMESKIDSFICPPVGARPSQQKDIPGTYAGYPDGMFEYPTIVLNMSRDITWTAHLRLTAYSPVGLKYPAQDISIYNDINNEPGTFECVTYLLNDLTNYAIDYLWLLKFLFWIHSVH